MAHQYTRRTYDEAQEIAQRKFRECVREHLTDTEIEELRSKGAAGGGTINDFEDWKELLGYTPDRRMHYEYSVYKPSDTPPYVEKFYARILVSRDRTSELVMIMWKPPVPPYDGPYYT